MYVVRYSFYFRYSASHIVIDIPVEEYIATERQLDEYEVWEYILEDPTLSEKISEQEQDYNVWLAMPDYYEKCLQRRQASLVLAKTEG